jgi:putative chitinase
MAVNYLIAYQRVLGLVPDGIIGPATAKAMMADLGVTDKVLFALVMGQAMHESGLWKNFRENLNYNEEGLLSVFGKYYEGRPLLLRQHAHQPEKIANYVYANRLENGNEASGDGWKYRGAFALQITGKANFIAFFKHIGLPLDTDPDSLKDNAKAYFQAAFFWFDQNDAVKLCTSDSDFCIDAVGKKVNRGNAMLGTPLALNNTQRKLYTKQIIKAVGIA